MHAVGRAFPRSDRAPMIEPVAEQALQLQLRTQPGLARWTPARTHRVARGFYISQALELARP
jgi:magnesium-protoporphyrin O-methyltransferase